MASGLLLPQPKMTPVPLAVKAQNLTTGSPGSWHKHFLNFFSPSYTFSIFYFWNGKFKENAGEIDLAPLLQGI